MGLITLDERKTDLYGRRDDDVWSADRKHFKTPLERLREVELVTGAGLSNRRERETPRPGLLDQAAARNAKDRSGRAGAGMPIFGSRASRDGGSMPWSYTPRGRSQDRGYVTLPDPPGGFREPDRNRGAGYDRYHTMGSELEYALFGPGERGHPPKAKFDPRDFGHVLSLRGALQGLRQRGFISEAQSEEIWQSRHARWFVFPRTSEDLVWDVVDRHAMMLEEIRDFMDKWVNTGMKASPGGRLEEYLIKIGRSHAVPNRPELGKTDLERGRRIVSAAWLVYRQFVEDAIRTAHNRSLIHIRRPVGASARKSLAGQGYAIDSELVLTGPARVMMQVMVEEPMHGRDKLFWGHTARGKWKDVDEGIGWDLAGSWQAGVERIMAYAHHVMSLTPASGVGSGGQAQTAWQVALERSGLNGR